MSVEDKQLVMSPCTCDVSVFARCKFSVVRFKQRAVIEFLTAEKVPPIEIHRRMQAVYGDQCVDVSGELGQADLSDKTPSGRISKTSAALAEVC